MNFYILAPVFGTENAVFEGILLESSRALRHAEGSGPFAQGDRMLRSTPAWTVVVIRPILFSLIGTGPRDNDDQKAASNGGREIIRRHRRSTG